MGGTIGFTIRKPDGVVVSKGQWTNGLNHLIDNIRLVNKDPEIIEQLIRRGDEDTGIYPISYGLVLVDCVKNVILDMNHYHAFGQFNATLLKFEMSCTHIDAHSSGYGPGEPLEMAAFDNEYADCYLFKQFWDANRIKRCKVLYKNDTRGLVEQSTEGMTLEDVVKLIKDENCYAIFYIDMTPFTVHTFPQSKQGCADLYEAVKALDLPLTAHDHAMWAEYMEQYEEK